MRGARVGQGDYDDSELQDDTGAAAVGKGHLSLSRAGTGRRR